MKAILEAITALVIMAYLGGTALESAHNFIRDKALEKAAQGLPSLSAISSQLTCSKWSDEAQDFVRLKTKGCQ